MPKGPASMVAGDAVLNGPDMDGIDNGAGGAGAAGAGAAAVCASKAGAASKDASKIER